MRKRNFKGKCIKVSSTKSKEICRTYDDVQLAYLKLLESRDNIKEIRCSVPLEDLPDNEYMTDFVCVKSDNEPMVRECLKHRLLTKPLTVKLLDISRNYWLSRGISDWGIVIDE